MITPNGEAIGTTNSDGTVSLTFEPENADTFLVTKELLLMLVELYNDGIRMRNSTSLYQVFDLPDGGVQIEWHAGDEYLEIEFRTDGSVEVVTAEAGSNIAISTELGKRGN